MRRVHRERREHRMDRVLKVLCVILLFFLCQLLVAQKRNVVLLQGRDQILAPDSVLVIHHFPHSGRNSSKLFSRAHPIGSPSLTFLSRCCFTPATRTSKNSSRFEATIQRNFKRSRSGPAGSWASSSTR